MGRLDGKHALITGGTSGIGLETARQFLAEGARVAITGRSQEGLDRARSDLGSNVLTIKSDASDIGDYGRLTDALAKGWPTLDILMCNAADITHLPIDQWTPERFDALMATNLKGPFFLIKSLLPLFSAQSSVVLVGSVSALIGHEGAAVYGAAKAGLMSLTRGLSYELRNRGIRVNAISPGPTATNSLSAVYGPEVAAALYDEFAQLIPIKRLGLPVEIAKAAVYLASDESAFTLAQVLRVDGGLGELATN